MLKTKVVEKIKTHVLWPGLFLKKLSLLWDSVVQTQNALLHFHCKHGYVNVPQCYVMPTLSVLYYWSLIYAFNWNFLCISHLLACVTSPVHLIHPFYLCMLEDKLWNFSFCSFSSVPHFLLLGSWFVLQIFFTLTLNFCSSQGLRVKVSHMKICKDCIAWMFTEFMNEDYRCQNLL